MSGGDTVFFGAGTWVGQITPPGGGTSNNRTCYADSGIWLNPKEFTGLSHITGAEVLTGWTRYSGNVYKTHLDYIPIANYEAMNTASDNDSLLAWAGSIGAVDAPGEFFHDARTDSIYVYCYNSGNPNDHTMLIANHYSPVVVYSDNSYITFIGLEISYGIKAIMILADQSASKLPDYINVFHCKVHHVNNDGGPQNPSGITTRGGGGNYDTSLYAHGDTIRACTVYATRCGSSWYGHNKNICFYSAISCVVESCYVAGGGIGINFKCDNGSDQPYNVVRYNVVEGASNGIDLYAHHIYDSVYGNIVRNGVGDNWGITLEGGGMDSGCVIFNNTIYNVAKPFVVGPYTSSGIEGTGVNRNFFKYNIVDYRSSDNLLTYNDDVTDTANMVWDNNVYYRNGGAITIDNVGSWASWQAAGFDVNSIVTNPGLNGSFQPTNIPPWDIPITYGGRTWYGPGAVQSLWEPDPDCDLPGKTNLESPANGATGVTLPISFDWQDVATANVYQIQIDNSSTFTSPEVDEFIVSSSAFDVTGLTSGLTYHWRVRAFNACGSGEWSDSRNFTTYCEQITAPDIAQPMDGADNQLQPITLDWSVVSGSDLYRVQVDDNPDFSSPERDQETALSDYTVSELEEGATYYWHVCAHNACGWSDWSPASSFTTFSLASQTFDIYDLEVLNITDTSALIEWKTTEEATSQVEYGLTVFYGSLSVVEPNYKLNHSVFISPLNHDTDYHFRVLCYNAEDDPAISPDSTFRTKSTISGNGSTLTGSSNT
ncbi:MAG: hypothetical protein JXA92_14095, partial [candidate division Zixibacteria bacterium]|nr:hypothetical protein [candidate division Zixibacteria bacterium]